MTVQIHQESDYRQATIGRFRVGFSEGYLPWANNPGSQSSDDGPKPETGASADAKTAEKDKNTTASAEPAAKEEAEKAKKDTDDESGDEDLMRTVGLPRKLARALEKPEAKRSKEQVALVRDYFEYTAPELTPGRLEIAKQEMNLSFLQGAVPEVMVTVTAPPRETRILPRGNWMDDSGDIVQPAIPEFLGHLNTADRRATRLDLANWLVSPQNPLTARVYMNRMWSEYFGAGISKSCRRFSGHKGLAVASGTAELAGG